MLRTLIHASDLHIGKSIPDRLAAFSAFVRARRPDLVVLTGDLVDEGRRREYTELEAYLASLSAPLLLTAGNHDAPVRSLSLRLFAPFARLERMRGYEPAARVGGDIAVANLRTAAAVQTRADWSLGDAPSGRVRRALAVLDASVRWRFIACHHALIDPPNAKVRAQTLNGVEAHRLIDGAGVDFILCGHGHRSFVGPLSTAQAAWTSLAPTLSSPRARGAAQGFHLFELGETEAAITLWEWKGLAFEPQECVRRAKGNGAPSGM
ncbi:MAG: metallophosphoesterase [Hyphomonadaceae bacterium]